MELHYVVGKKFIKMEDRILINGIWYVKESSIEEKAVPEELIEIYSYIGFTCETDDYHFEAKRYYRDDNETFFQGISIDFRDKIQNTTDFWDSVSWMKGVLENNPDSLEEARFSLNEKGINALKLLLKKLEEKGWL